jgi:hypothetical protein
MVLECHTRISLSLCLWVQQLLRNFPKQAICISHQALASPSQSSISVCSEFLFVSSYINAVVPIITVFSLNLLFSLKEANSNKDWHIILGHALDVYLKKVLDLFKLSPNNKTGLSKNCEFCHMAKLKRSSHSNPLPLANSPFKMIHMELLHISPVSHGSFQYILVLTDDFLQFNRIYLLQKKNESEVKIKLFLNEIKNHTDITPVILHTNQGGEFGSIVFKNFLSQQGISLEPGPANSPQTNCQPT